MTVYELIQELSNYPADAPVRVTVTTDMNTCTEWRDYKDKEDEEFDMDAEIGAINRAYAGVMLWVDVEDPFGVNDEQTD